MKKYWTISAFFFFTVGSSLIVACNSGGGGSNNNSTLVPANTQTCVNGVCYYAYGTSAQYMTNSQVRFATSSSASGGAYSGNGYNSNVANGGFYANGANGYNNIAGVTQATASMQIQSGFTALLRDVMGVCDRQQFEGGANYGATSCSTWAQGQQFLSFTMNGADNNTGITLNIQSQSAPSNYYFNRPSLSAFVGSMMGLPSYSNPTVPQPSLSLAGSLYITNNNQGFEIRAYGQPGSVGANRLIQLQVPNGNVNNQNVPFILYYNSQQAATGTMTNCTTGACGF